MSQQGEAAEQIVNMATNVTVGNGNFYSKTKVLVKKYQREHNLVPDGVAGPLTIAALGGNWTKEVI